mmetsp:Transcript_78768/g.254481  ORF Transcript_78768/g.254481 Transcript_78768/m.254481 type:complete len:221 (+) Transcript_78768:1613-2275(+)
MLQVSKCGCRAWSSALGSWAKHGRLSSRASHLEAWPLLCFSTRQSSPHPLWRISRGRPCPRRCSSSRTLARRGTHHLVLPGQATVQIQKGAGKCTNPLWIGDKPVHTLYGRMRRLGRACPWRLSGVFALTATVGSLQVLARLDLKHAWFSENCRTQVAQQVSVAVLVLSRVGKIPYFNFCWVSFGCTVEHRGRHDDLFCSDSMPLPVLSAVPLSLAFTSL